MKRRHRCPWTTAPAPAWTVEAGAVVVREGFVYTVAELVRPGLPRGPDGLGACVVLALAHPAGRRGRPRRFEAPTLQLLACDPVELRADAEPADWTGF
ncbi:hypothetical protein [Thalassobaculum sp.]|uniref:hypothetical protein n=1 Tax=Thalassobaculum sp. TaxID=2022740 RepID=UPI0032EE4C8C